MDIAGGLYRELCDVPCWNALFGSGGRAAAAVTGLTADVSLHTYCRDREAAGVSALEKLGVVVHAHPAADEIAFAYFHPLSTPHVEPARDTVRRAPSISVSGQVVLRFGFIEGDAIVQAETAVYDPQTHLGPEAFHGNGSSAERLAVVLNEAEVRALGRSADLADAAGTTIDEQNAEVVVVKRGVRGALVFERGRAPRAVSAFRSDRVFKIGTGDVFSATFAYHWGERRAPASDAAEEASRAVAAYCSSRSLPPSPSLAANAAPVGTERPGSVLLLGETGSLGSRWLMEEARFRLQELGVVVHAPGLDPRPPRDPASAVLILADGMSDRPTAHWDRSAGLPFVILCERREPDWLRGLAPAVSPITNDFASAIYFAAWATTPASASATGQLASPGPTAGHA